VCDACASFLVNRTYEFEATRAVSQVLESDLFRPGEYGMTSIRSNVRREFAEKLSSLNSTQKKISSLADLVVSRWRFVDDLVRVWESEIYASKQENILNLIYLANDALQKSRAKRKAAIRDAFSKVLHPTLKHAIDVGDHNVKTKLKRVVSIWRDRSILEDDVLDHVENLLGMARSEEKGDRIASTNTSADTITDVLKENDTSDVSSDVVVGANMDETEKMALSAFKDIEILPTAEDVLDAMKKMDEASIQAEFLSEDILSLRLKMEKYARYEKEKLHANSDDSKTIAISTETVSIDVKEAAKVMKRWRTHLKQRKSRLKRMIGRMKTLKETIAKSEDDKFQNENDELAAKSASLKRIKEVDESIQKRRREMVEEEALRVAQAERERLEKRRKIEAEAAARAERSRRMRMGHSRRPASSLLRGANTDRGVDGRRMGIPTGYSSYQDRGNGSGRRGIPSGSYSYRNDGGGGGGGGNFASRRSRLTSPPSHGRGRGRAAVVPAWMSKQNNDRR